MILKSYVFLFLSQFQLETWRSPTQIFAKFLYLSRYLPYLFIFSRVFVQTILTYISNEVQKTKIALVAYCSILFFFFFLFFRCRHRLEIYSMFCVCHHFSSVMNVNIILRLVAVLLRMRYKLICVFGRKANFPANYQAQQGENSLDTKPDTHKRELQRTNKSINKKKSDKCFDIYVPIQRA